MATPSPRGSVSTVRTFARRHGILRPGPLVLAVSGGADSTALALVLSELSDEFGLVLHVAHFDHRTRPRQAPADASFVADVANRIGAPVRVGRAARAPKSEDEARRDRYEFLRRVAAEVGATAIATGHTRDDQAETVLLHLTRGSGIAGVAGMRPLRDGIARPLLAIGRAETEALCRAAGIVPREDPSNRSLRYARNRVRRKVLPELEAINPQVRAAIARFAETAAEIDDELQHGELPRSQGAQDTTLTRVIDIATLPRSVVARGTALAHAWRETTGRSLSTRHRDALLALVGSTDGTSRIDLPGGTAVREYERLRLPPSAAPTRVTRGPHSRPAARVAGHGASATRRGPATPLRMGETVEWHGWRISLGMSKDGLPLGGSVDQGTATALQVRARRPGDRLRGRKKLQDVFVDAKVPVRLRDTWPILALDDVVIWVPGLTPPPTGGTTVLAAGPVGNDAAAGDGFLGNFTRVRQVASKSEVRPRGGKRGRP